LPFSSTNQNLFKHFLNSPKAAAGPPSVFPVLKIHLEGWERA